MARVSLPQSKIKARRKKRRIIIAGIAAGALLAVLVVLVALAHAPFMRITTVMVSGQSTVDSQAISKAVLGDISGSYLYLFPKNNIFLYPKFATEADIAKQMPTILTIAINAKDFHTLTAVVTERTRKALWCGAQAATGGPCFWLDENGVAFAAAADLSLGLDAGSGYQHYYGALTGDAPRQFTTPEQFHALSALVDAIAQNQTNNAIQSTEVDSAGDVRVTFADRFVLMFSLSSAGADVYERFQLVLGSDAFAGHTLADFQYLDMRFGDKLYYKLRDNETPVKK